MDKEKQIEGMALDVCGAKEICKGGCNISCEFYTEAINLYNKGYRKADEVIDEFIERLKEEDEISRRRYGKGIGMYDIYRIADKMKFELFKQREEQQ